MTEYPDNSYKTKAEQKASPGERQKLDKVVSGAVKTKKPNELKKLTDVFIAEDVSNVKNYIWMDVLVPSIKKAISDIVRNGIDMILYGEVSRSKGNTISSKVSYDRFYDRRDDDRGRVSSAPRARTGFDYDRITFESRGDAESVLSLLQETLDNYEVVSVADLYDAAGLSTDNYMVNRYGWYSLNTAEVKRVSDGYVICMPKAVPLNN